MLDGRWRAKAEESIEPVGRALHRLGVSADALTIFGLAAAVGTAFLIANGNLALAVVGLILSGLPDVLDGSVARQSGTAGARGAFFDSVCDRVADAVILGGVAWHLADEDAHLAVLALAVVALTMLVSYERAKAESLGLDARGGLMERLERMVLLGVGLAFDILVPVLWVMLALTAITAVHRFVMVWRQATPAPADRPAPRRRVARSHRVRRPRRLSRVPGRR
jgi:CDP-diacylglycerol--glycerol-3-phosphate 3-phosphatidyltransferase